LDAIIEPFCKYHKDENIVLYSRETTLKENKTIFFLIHMYQFIKNKFQNLCHNIRNGCKLHDTLIFLVIQTPRKFNFGEKYLCFLDNTPAVLMYLIQVIYMHICIYNPQFVSFYARYYIQAFKSGLAQNW